MKKTLKENLAEDADYMREYDRRERHTIKALRILGLKPEIFGFQVMGPRTLLLNAQAKTHMLDLTLGLSLGMSDKVTAKDKEKALVELLQTLDKDVLSTVLARH